MLRTDADQMGTGLRQPCAVCKQQQKKAQQSLNAVWYVLHTHTHSHTHACTQIYSSHTNVVYGEYAAHYLKFLFSRIYLSAHSHNLIQVPPCLPWVLSVCLSVSCVCVSVCVCVSDEQSSFFNFESPLLPSFGEQKPTAVFLILSPSAHPSYRSPLLVLVPSHIILHSGSIFVYVSPPQQSFRLTRQLQRVVRYLPRICLCTAPLTRSYWLRLPADKSIFSVSQLKGLKNNYSRLMFAWLSV